MPAHVCVGWLEHLLAYMLACCLWLTRTITCCMQMFPRHILEYLSHKGLLNYGNPEESRHQQQLGEPGSQKQPIQALEQQEVEEGVEEGGCQAAPHSGSLLTTSLTMACKSMEDIQPHAENGEHAAVGGALTLGLPQAVQRQGTAGSSRMEIKRAPTAGSADVDPKTAKVRQLRDVAAMARRHENVTILFLE